MLGNVIQQLLTQYIAGQVPIDMVPDEVLLEMFAFYLCEYTFDSATEKKEIEAWLSLVHVCRRWRSIISGSKNRLQLQLACTSRIPARDMLDVWPDLPLVICDEDFLSEGVDNIVGALECGDRMHAIKLLNVGDLPMEKVLAEMQVPFLALESLGLHSTGTVTIIPDSFLGGYAPNLELLYLDRIPIPGLPGLLSHSTRLSQLYLGNIPHSGYFSSEELVTCLSALRELDELSLQFESPLSRPDRASRHPPPSTRSVLPALSILTFKGVSEYLEDLVARIDAPQLPWLDITFFNQIDFDVPQLVRFVSRTQKLKAVEKAHLAFRIDAAVVNLSSVTDHYEHLSLEISCRELDWQVSSLEQLCTSFIPSISTPEDLYIYQFKDSKPDWKDNIENALWLALLQPFTAVKNLHLSKEFAPRIVPALQELIGGRTTEVLPTLQNILLEEFQQSVPVQDAIRTFVAARQLSNHPVTVSRWERDSA
jgi:hypothetical protein